MQFKPAVVAIFIAASLAAAAPPVPNAKLVSGAVGPAATFGKGAAYIDDDGFTTVFYQAADGSVRELKGQGPPLTNTTYDEEILLAPTQVRKNTPMAALITNNDQVRARSFQLYPLFLERWLTISTRYRLQYHLYYINTENRLCELDYNGDIWAEGSLDGEDIVPKLNSNYIYGIEGTGDVSSRVGYQCQNGRLCEVYYVDGGWTQREF